MDRYGVVKSISLLQQSSLYEGLDAVGETSLRAILRRSKSLDMFVVLSHLAQPDGLAVFLAPSSLPQ